MKMKKRLLSILLSLALVLGLLPGMSVTALADGHTHSFTYSAEGDTITATCQNEGCSLTENKVTLRIVPNSVLYYDDGQPKEASLEGLDEFNAATGKNITTDDIAYYKGDTNVTAQIKAGSGISIKGATYTARLDVEGKRATVTFQLTAKPVEHTHSFTYTANGNIITATCNSTTGTCDLTNKQATLTLNAPLHTTYGDGKDANATLTGEIPGVTNPTIHYSKGSVTLNSAPTDAGTYTAWCQLGNATARVEYTIAKATNPGWTTLPQAKANLVYIGEPLELITAGTASAGNALYTAGTDPDNEPDDTAGGRPYTSSVPEMTNAGIYYVWCKIDGGKNYTSINAQKVEVTIAKANPTATAPSGSATYGQTLADVTLTNPEGNTPGTWAWVDSTTSVGSVGDNTFKANFTPTDTTNYNSVSDVEVTVNVGKADAVTATVTANNRTYDGTEKPLVTVDNSTLVGGEMQYALGTATEATQPYTASIPTGIDVGTYYVWYKVVGDENHFDTEPAPVKVTISNPAGGGGTADAVQQVVDKINALSVPDQVTVNDEKLIKEAREAYDKLSDTQKQDSRLTQAIKDKLGDCETALDKVKKADEDQKAAGEVSKQIEALPAADKVTTADKATIESARKAYDSLTDDQKKKVSEDTLKKLVDAETALAAAQVKSVKTVTINAGTINAKAVNKAVAKAGGSSKYVKTFVIGKNVKKISKGAFKKYKNAKTLVVKTRKLKKSTVKNSLKGSKITKVKVKVGNKKTNKKYVKKYKKIFTKKNAGKKVKVSL